MIGRSRRCVCWTRAFGAVLIHEVINFWSGYTTYQVRHIEAEVCLPENGKSGQFGLGNAAKLRYAIVINEVGNFQRDTHDFEYYKEKVGGDGPTRTMHHFVNGGGGAYLSIGTALDFPKQPDVAD